MSFDLFVGSFVGGDPASFPAGILYNSFRPFIVATERNCHVLRFGPDESDTCTLFVDTTADEITDFSINNPIADDRLFDALFAVLNVPGLVLYFAGECPPLVGSADSVEHLPKDMIESLGKPLILAAASEIPRYIEQA